MTEERKEELLKPIAGTVRGDVLQMIWKLEEQTGSNGWTKRADGTWTRSESGLALHIDSATEARMDVEVRNRPDVYGEKLSADVAQFGLRAAFPLLYGFPIVWGAEKFELSKA